MYGQAIKTIRKMKGMTQKEVYTGVVSKSFYSDFEAEKYSMSIDKFIGITQNLGISMEEFFYFQQDGALSTSQQQETVLDNLYKQGKFEELFAFYETYFSSSQAAFRYLAAKAYLLVLITNHNFYQFSRVPFQEILALLEGTTCWTLNEIKLAKLVLLAIPEKELMKATKLFERIQAELQKYEGFQEHIYEKELADLYFNRIQSLLMLNAVADVKPILNKYEAIVQQADDLTLYTQFKFMTAIAGLYTDYPTCKEVLKLFLKQVADVPVSECRFYQIIFQLHNEKAKNYYMRYTATK